MLDFIVLGLIPGTNISLGFTAIMLLILSGCMVTLKNMGTLHTPKFAEKIGPHELHIIKNLKKFINKKVHEISV